MPVAEHPTGMLYNASVNYKTTFPKRQCNNNVAIVCGLLSRTILQMNKKLNCTAEGIYIYYIHMLLNNNESNDL